MCSVTPHGLFTDGAVLQQGMRVPVWGTANDGETVTVTIQNQKVSTTATDGKWMVWLKPLRAGGPFTMTLAGENTVEVRDLLVGEVWVCSGQSNMEWPLAMAANAQEALPQSTDPMLRLFTINHAESHKPLHEVSSRWKSCDPETVAHFSAVGYFFGRDLRRALKVPVGLISSCRGGTPAEAWTSRNSLENCSELRTVLAKYERRMERYVAALEAYRDAVKEQETVATVGLASRERPQRPSQPGKLKPRRRPSVLYNAMIVPLQPYAIRGVIWYQGEANARRAYQYQTLFSAMIRSWRADWGEGDFPFLFAQLAPFRKSEAGPQDSSWAELREAQRQTALAVRRTTMVVTTDVGEENDIHPPRKELVGTRLALAARAVAYHQRIECVGPTYRTMQVQGDRVILRFKHVGGGLVARGEELLGFTIAGEDRQFVNARAAIKGARVVVSSSQVPHPVAVRYGWANYPVVNLYNKAGLPASPFRTDDFPLTTQTALAAADGPTRAPRIWFEGNLARIRSHFPRSLRPRWALLALAVLGMLSQRERAK